MGFVENYGLSLKAVSYKNDVAFWDPSQISLFCTQYNQNKTNRKVAQKPKQWILWVQNREICEGSQKAKSFLFETAFNSHL